MRLMLGIGESVAFPSCSKILARHLPQYHRGFANGVIASAFSCGNAVGSFGAGIVMAKYVVSRTLPTWSHLLSRDS
jgi:MFS family permease